MKSKLRVRTLILSDLHLGMKDSRSLEAAHLLRHTRCDQLILNGDIIDWWALKSSGKWLPKHTHFLRSLLKKMEKERVEVIYLRGNHDEVLENFGHFTLPGIRFGRQHILERGEQRYLVVHGDGFDHVCTHHLWLAKVGAIGYDLLLRFNRLFNAWRRLRRAEAFSLSQWVKSRVKQAMKFVGAYEQQLQGLARGHGCNGIICGHIHTAADRVIGGVHYLNSGDWVESCTAVIEHHDGSFEVIDYPEFCRRTHRLPKGTVHQRAALNSMTSPQGEAEAVLVS